MTTSKGKTPPSHGNGWNTEKEIYFLEKLGTHRPMKYRPREWKGRRELLRSYLLTMDGRDDWGNMDRDRVRKYIQGELEKR